jgi:hypothetical protein
MNGEKSVSNRDNFYDRMHNDYFMPIKKKWYRFIDQLRDLTGLSSDPRINFWTSAFLVAKGLKKFIPDGYRTL